MQRTVIDRFAWERRDNFSFFEGFLNPFISITSEVECSAARSEARQQERSFFLYYLYAVTRAANEIPELRFRFWGPDEAIVVYDRVDVIAPIKLKDRNMFYTVRIPYCEDFGEFYEGAKRIIDAIPQYGDPYASQREEQGEYPDYDVILLSAIPDLHFTAITYTQKHRNGSDFPLLNAGKAVQRDGGLYMPLSISFHHGFADGAHISDFFSRVQKYLNVSFV